MSFTRVGQDLLGETSTNSEEVLFGTSIHLTSAKRLLVGAPMHDYTTPLPSNSSVQDNGGGVFLYEFNESSSTFETLWFLSGSYEGEKIGSSLSVSQDGSVVAVRRQQIAKGLSYAQVYNVTNPSQAQIIGDPVSCPTGSHGSTVSLSPNGMRLALSCESVNSNTGRVDIYEFTDKWKLMGSFDGFSSGDLFGWSTAFSNYGNRIVISAPNYDRNDETRVGLVQVYEFTEIEWIQVGMDILGQAQGDQLGYSVDLNGNDGTILVASSPGGDSDHGMQVGTVRVFEDYKGGWTLKGQPLHGHQYNNRFGRSVSISDNGSRVAASSYIHDNSRGHVLVYEFVDSQYVWVQHGEDIDGQNPKDRFGSGLESVSLSGDGNFLASGSTYFNDSGRVRVFDLDVTRTLSPTASPPMPSSSPSLAAPGAEEGWDIALDSVTVHYDASSFHKEIELLYTVGDHENLVKVFQGDCATLVDDSVVAVDKAVVPLEQGSPVNNLAVQMKVKPRFLDESPVFVRRNAQTGTIQLCVRVDLLDDETHEPVLFATRNIVVDLDLARNFEIQNQRIPTDAMTVHVDASLDYDVRACQCNARSLECRDGSPVARGSTVILCLTVSDATELEVGGIQSLDYSQGRLSHAAILDGIADGLTIVAVVGNTTVVQTRMDSDFYEGLSSNNVQVKGSCTVAFSGSSDDSRRFLSRGRSLEKVSRDFVVDLKLLEESDEPPSAMQEEEEEEKIKVRLSSGSHSYPLCIAVFLSLALFFL